MNAAMKWQLVATKIVSIATENRFFKSTRPSPSRAKLGSIADVAITMLPRPALETGWDGAFLVKTQYPAVSKTIV